MRHMCIGYGGGKRCSGVKQVGNVRFLKADNFCKIFAQFLHSFCTFFVFGPNEGSPLCTFSFVARPRNLVSLPSGTESSLWGVARDDRFISIWSSISYLESVCNSQLGGCLSCDFSVRARPPLTFTSQPSLWAMIIDSYLYDPAFHI